MVLTAAETLLGELLEKIAQFEQENIGELVDPNSFIKITNHFMEKLQSLVLEGNFSDHQEEIIFFKTVKPKFLSLQIYYLTLQEIILRKPSGCKKILIKFYTDEIRKICAFRCTNQQLINYYFSGASDMDPLLFLRKVDMHPHWLLRPRLERDERFSTPADYLVAKFIAMDKTQAFLCAELAKLEFHNPAENFNDVKKQYRWTGEAINLVELAYGLYYTGEINNGNAGIAEIVRLFETTFNISIGKPSRRFAEIKQRKRLSKTKYLDQMKTAIDKRIDEEDEFVPRPNFR